ncbi:MAG TPA: hypothetical protein PLE74_06845 [Candidatus Cloacimonadota bacterium]|nr:hypothetical protein [Candidatus Cloacimonadota bacterium]
MDKLIEKLGKEMVSSPFLSIMILNTKNEIVWHNKRFAKDFKHGPNLIGMKCFNVIGSDTPHVDCPLAESLNHDKRMKGFLDFGEQNFFFLTVPLDKEHAAKIHVFLPKEPDNMMVGE